MFGDDYMKFKSYMMPGLFLFLEGTAARNTWGEQNLEFKIRNIDLLNEIGNKRVRGLALKIEADNVTFEFVTMLEKACKKHSGKQMFQLYISDSSLNSPLQEIPARLCQINPNNALIQELKRLGEVGVITEKSPVRWLTEQVIKEPLAQKAEVGTISSTFVLESILS